MKNTIKKERSDKGVLFISEKITIQINAVPITTLPIL